MDVLKDLILPLLNGVISALLKSKEIIVILILILVVKILFPIISQIRFNNRKSQSQSFSAPPTPLSEEDNEIEINEFAELPYKPKFDFLTKAELSFFKVLLLVSKDYNFHIFAKVRLADLVYLSKNTGNWRTYFNKVQSKHVDFVVCDSNNVKPLFVVELDDSSHKQDKRINRDEFVDNVLTKAGLPILRIPAQYSYNVAYISSKIETIIMPNEEVAASGNFEV